MTGSISSIVVTPYAVFMAEKATCALFRADKPIESARGLVSHACGVAAMARTDGALFWMTAPTNLDPDAAEVPGMLAMVADDGPEPVVLDATLHRPRGIAVLGGDNVYVAVFDGIRRVAPGSKPLEHALDGVAPQTLRAFGGALYWHEEDGFQHQHIYAWRPGEAKATRLVEDADVRARVESSPSDDPFEVDASGFYWMSQDFFGGGSTLRHAALGGGIAGTLMKPKGYVTSLALEEDNLYWSEASSFPRNGESIARGRPSSARRR